MGLFCPSVLLSSEGPDTPHHSSILGVPEEGQTGRAGLSSAQGQTGIPSDTDTELRSGPCSASRCWVLGTDSGSVAAGWAPAGSSFNPLGPRAPHLYDGATWEAMRRCRDERSAGRGLCPLFGDINTVWRLLRSAGTDARGAQDGRSCGAWAPPPRVLLLWPRLQDTPGFWLDMSLPPVCPIVRLFRTLT